MKFEQLRAPFQLLEHPQTITRLHLYLILDLTACRRNLFICFGHVQSEGSTMALATSVWTDERVDQLRKLVADGMSAKEISNEMHLSRNAVIGKTHRMGIIIDSTGAAARNGGHRIKAPNHRSIQPDSRSNLPRPRAVAAVKQQQHPLPVFRVVVDNCQWPIGDVGAEDFHFCGAAVKKNKPYCAEHCAKAHDTQQAPRRENHVDHWRY